MKSSSAGQLPAGTLALWRRGLLIAFVPFCCFLAVPPFCLLSIPSTRQRRKAGLCVPAQILDQPEIPQVIHAAYCFLSCSQRRFSSLAPLTLPLSCSSLYRRVSPPSLPPCLKPQRFLLHKIPELIYVIRLILNNVNQFFQMVGRTHEREREREHSRWAAL